MGGNGRTLARGSNTLALLAALCAVPAIPSSSAAQGGWEPEAGTRVRILVGPITGAVTAHAFTGTVEEVRGDTLRMRTDRGAAPLTVPIETIRRLEVSAGQKGRGGRGALIGAGAGGILVAVIAAADASSCEGWCFVSPGAAFAGGFVLGALPGAVVGTIIGSGIKVDRWQHDPRLPLRADLSVGSSAGGRGLALTGTLRM